MTTPHETPDALRFYMQLHERTTVAACAEVFKETVAQFGIHAFACGEIDLAERDRNVMFIAEWPQAWIRYYIKSGLVERDPILNALKVCRCAISFNDIRHDPRFSKLDRDMMRAAAEHGWARGLAAPIARGGTRFGLVTVIGHGHGQEFEPSQRTFLTLISECLITRIRSLGPDFDYVAPAGMSKREIEAARLVARGFSDDEIAVELGISPSTAHHHVERARSRLKARTRAHLAALCVSLGIAAAT